MYRRGEGALFRKSPFFADYPRRGSRNNARLTQERAGTPRQGCPLTEPKHFRRSATAFAVYHDAGADARAMEDCETWTETQQERKSAAG